MSVGIRDEGVVEVDEKFLVSLEMTPGLDPSVGVHGVTEISIIDDDSEFWTGLGNF